jgi:hypothetical protein
MIIVELLMRITEGALRCSVFLGFSNPTDPSSFSSVLGTGFFIAHDQTGYLVTAAHIAQTLTGSPFGVRLTDEDGNGRIEEILAPRWHYHPDNTVDLAILQFEVPDWTMTTAMPSSELATDDKVVEWEIGPGDAAYVVGLFHLHPGKRRNLPVVHAGNIALMPSEERIPIRDQRTGKAVDISAYLVEAGALSGASGSPVMVRPTIRFMARAEPHQVETAAILESRDYLLGVWVAAWPGNPDPTLAVSLGLESKTWIPVGIGIVVPAQRILEILELPAVVLERQAANS